MNNKKCSITTRRPSKNPALRKVLHALETGASIKVKDSGVVSLAGSLSRTAKRRNGTRFSIKSLSDGTYKVTRVKAQETQVYSDSVQYKLHNMIDKLKEVVKREIKFLDQEIKFLESLE